MSKKKNSMTDRARNTKNMDDAESWSYDPASYEESFSSDITRNPLTLDISDGTPARQDIT
jgi:hypothetical protein